MKVTLSLFFPVVVALISACNGFDPQGYVPGLYTDTPAMSQEEDTLLPISLAPTILSLTPKPISIITVCTNTPGGKLNVRFTPGNNGEVRGYLIENENVTTSGESEEVDGTVWVKLSHPIEGWVNVRFLCKVSNE